MSAITKIPPFILSHSNDGSRMYIIHTKEPAFIAKIIYPASDEERQIKSKLDYWIELEAPRTIIGIIELWQPVSSEDRLKAVLKRMKHWYCSIVNEQKL